MRAGLVFMSRGRLYFHVPQLYRKLLLKVSDRVEPRRDRNVLENSDDHGGILENVISHGLNGSFFLLITPHSLVCLFMYNMCFYTFILLPFYRRYSTKIFTLHYVNKLCCLEKCLPLHSSVLKPWPLVYIKNRVDLLGECCRTISCCENRCDFTAFYCLERENTKSHG
jgi:hypothetical protein